MLERILGIVLMMLKIVNAVIALVERLKRALFGKLWD